MLKHLYGKSLKYLTSYFISPYHIMSNSANIHTIQILNNCIFLLFNLSKFHFIFIFSLQICYSHHWMLSLTFQMLSSSTLGIYFTESHHLSPTTSCLFQFNVVFYHYWHNCLGMNTVFLSFLTYLVLQHPQGSFIVENLIYL